MGVARFFIKIAVSVAVIFPLFIISVFGAGDVKLISLAAGFFSLDRIPWFALFMMIGAAAVSIIRLVIDRKMNERFRYFFKYARNLILTRKIEPYPKSREEQVREGVVMSGPILFSVMMAVGGVY